MERTALCRHPRRRYAWPIPALRASDLALERPAGPRWLLAGDAAGLVDPITREGIYYALASAELAARALLADSPDTTPDDQYGRLLGGEIYPEIERAARLKRLFFRPWFSHLLVQALGRSPAVASVMVDLVAGRQPYRGLRRRLLRTGEIGLAGRLAWLEGCSAIGLQPDGARLGRAM
jgi:flavin-dependent dehydrogenase